MAGRSSVFSDERIIAKAGAFTCATDEVWRLQRGTDRECRFFQTMISGRPDALHGSHQGIYIITPAGQLLSKRNSLSADQVLSLLDDGWKKWSALEPEQKEAVAAPSQFRPRHRWEHSYPERGLVLVSVLRDLPLPDSNAAKNTQRWNRDHIWFNHGEARSWLPTELKPGVSHTLPRPLALRLARFHLVDNVRGQVGPFAPEEIEHAEFRTEIISVSRDQVELMVHGRAQAVSDGVWKMGENDWKRFPNRPRSITTNLVGRAVFDREQDRFVEFEAVAHGRSTGGVGLNGRRGPDAKGSIGYYLSLAPATPQHRIAPAFIDVYDAGWVTPPPKE